MYCRRALVKRQALLPTDRVSHRNKLKYECSAQSCRQAVAASAQPAAQAACPSSCMQSSTCTGEPTIARAAAAVGEDAAMAAFGASPPASGAGGGGGRDGASIDGDWACLDGLVARSRAAAAAGALPRFADSQTQDFPMGAQQPHEGRSWLGNRHSRSLILCCDALCHGKLLSLLCGHRCAESSWLSELFVPADALLAMPPPDPVAAARRNRCTPPTPSTSRHVCDAVCLLCTCRSVC